MPVKEADPNAQQLDGAFADAMNAPAKPKEAPAPPPIDPEAPHGRDADGQPLAPFGLTVDGRPRKTAAGRKAKKDQARTTDAQPAAPEDKPGAELPARDYSAALMDTGETIWFGGSVLAKVGPQIPVLGRFIPGRKLAATMAVFDSERPRLAAALNLAAEHDARARRLAERLADNEAGWALSCMFMVAPFAGAVAAVWQGDKALAERELPALDVLAKANEDALDRALAKITAQMEMAQLAATQQAAAEFTGQDGQQPAAAVNGQVTAGA